eukprot:3499199-Alexandrium_andersonii.AAC.1
MCRVLSTPPEVRSSLLGRPEKTSKSCPPPRPRQLLGRRQRRTVIGITTAHTTLEARTQRFKSALSSFLRSVSR